MHYCLTLTRLDQIRLLDLQPQPAVAFLAGTCPTFGQDVIWNHPYSSCMTFKTIKRIKCYFHILFPSQTEMILDTLT